jgi:hypothetical protein
MNTHTQTERTGSTHTAAPAEARLAQAARILRIGAAAAGVCALALVVAAGAAGVFGLTAVLDALRAAAFLMPGPADTALALAVLVSLANISALLVLTVGVTAREPWALVGLGAAVLVNGAALLVFGALPAAIGIGAAGAALASAVQAGALFRANPVMRKELRGRMRGVRAFVLLTFYLVLMSGFALLIYLVLRTAAGGDVSASGAIGRALFFGVVGIQMLLIVFLAPSFTAGAITGERERQTYDLLQTTLLSTPSFVMGKLESALGYVLLLLLAGIPLQSLAFLFGGISEVELLLAFIMLLVLAIALGTVGLYFSAVFTRTLTASVRAYGAIALAVFVMPLVLGTALRVFTLRASSWPPALEALSVYLGLLLTAINPVATAVTTQALLIERDTLTFYPYTLASTGGSIPLISPWIAFVIVYLTAAALLLVVSVRRTQRDRDRA